MTKVKAAGHLRVSVSSFVEGFVEEGDLDVREFETAHANVSLSVGRTVNLQDFNSLRVDVSVNIPCYVEEIPAVTRRAKSYVIKTLETVTASAKAKIDASTPPKRKSK